jgi:hypothetical protein
MDSRRGERSTTTAFDCAWWNIHLVTRQTIGAGKDILFFCLEGSMTTELADGREFILRPGMSYEVSDELSQHRTSSVEGVKLLIVDGGFLKRERSAMM